ELARDGRRREAPRGSTRPGRGELGDVRREHADVDVVELHAAPPKPAAELLDVDAVGLPCRGAQRGAREETFGGGVHIGRFAAVRSDPPAAASTSPSRTAAAGGGSSRPTGGSPRAGTRPSQPR